jgi:hypothetical protein
MISVRDILNAFGDRAFAALMLVFAAPNMFPLPPGVSAVLGAPLLFITAQLMLGYSSLRLPHMIADRSMRREVFVGFTAKLDPVVKRAESILRPRLTGLLRPIPERLIGAACLILAVILFLPIPFGNIPPAIAISLFSLGILERDGLAVSLGWLAVLGSGLILAAVSSAIIAAIEAFFDHLWVLI